ncbi:transcriptional regulator [Nocardioides korecus]
MPETSRTPESRPRAYAGVGGDERRQRRRDQLVSSTLDLVGESGVAGLTVAAVSTHAGLSKRYFYETFASLDEAVGVALQAVLDQVARDVEGSDLGPGAAPAEVIGAAVRAALTALEEPRAARLYVESAAVPAAHAIRERATQEFVDQVLRQVVGPSYADPRAQLLGHLLVSGTTHVATVWLRGELDLDRDELVGRLTAIGVAAVEQLGPA